MSITVLNAGVLCTVQDLGRTGWRHLGVGVAGALDPLAARVANLLAGNDETAAVIEIAPGLSRLRVETGRHVAWCGADFAVRVGAVFLPPGRRCGLPARCEIEFRGPRTGCRAWLAISGGVNVPLTGGSRSTDLRGGFGGHEGRALRAGDVLPLGKNLLRAPRALRLASWSASPDLCRRGGQTELRVLRGSHTSTHFFGADFTVSNEADRMGVRLDGVLPGEPPGELISEPVAPGTIQLPPNGRPILLLADAQTVGGYARLAHVIAPDLAHAAQFRPCDRVRFREVTVAEARAASAADERALAPFRAAMRLRQEGK